MIKSIPLYKLNTLKKGKIMYKILIALIIFTTLSGCIAAMDPNGMKSSGPNHRYTYNVD